MKASRHFDLSIMGLESKSEKPQKFTPLRNKVPGSRIYTNKYLGFSHLCYISMSKAAEKTYWKKRNQTQTTKDLHRILIYEFDKSLQNSFLKFGGCEKIRGHYSRPTTLQGSLWDKSHVFCQKLKCIYIFCSQTHRFHVWYILGCPPAQQTVTTRTTIFVVGDP